MATGDPARKNLRVRTGDTFRKTFMWGEPGARMVSDLAITAGSAFATSEEADFTPADNTKKLALHDGVGLADGVTMTYVDEHTVELSEAATVTRVGVRAVVRALNCSAYGNHLAQFKHLRGEGAPLATFDLDATRAAVGVFVLSLSAAVTLGFQESGGWDWQCTTPSGDVKTWVEGSVIVVKDYTRVAT